jgi:hypothetical protein
MLMSDISRLLSMQTNVLALPSTFGSSIVTKKPTTAIAFTSYYQSFPRIVCVKSPLSLLQILSTRKPIRSNMGHLYSIAHCCGLLHHSNRYGYRGSGECKISP